MIRHWREALVDPELESSLKVRFTAELAAEPADAFKFAHKFCLKLCPIIALCKGINPLPASSVDQYQARSEAHDPGTFRQELSEITRLCS